MASMDKFEERYERHRRLEVRPVVFSDYRTVPIIHQAEIAVLGANWTVGLQQTSKELADAEAAQHVEAIQALIEKTIRDYINKQGWKKAKA